jgi:hypothetical protein
MRGRKTPCGNSTDILDAISAEFGITDIRTKMPHSCGKPNSSRFRRHDYEEERASAIRRPTQEEIARLAYSYWEERGGKGGTPEDDWRRAERALRGY